MGPAGPTLVEVLEEARARGFLGPGAVTDHLDHARAFLDATPPPNRALDLGSGAGIPGLALALAWGGSKWALVEANGRRARFLVEAAARLGLEERVEVWTERAEVLGREPERRAGRDLAVARSFGPPAVTAECAAPFLSLGGSLAVSEPPEGGAHRWPEEGLAQLGLRAVGVVGGNARVMVFGQERLCPTRFPRRAPSKRLLFA